MKKRGGGGGRQEAQNNLRSENKNSNNLHVSNEVMSPPPPLEEIQPLVPRHSSITMWTYHQFKTGPLRFPSFQIRKHEDVPMEKVQIFGLYESILMNFVEAVAETDIPPFLNAAFQVILCTYLFLFTAIAYIQFLAGVFHWRYPTPKGLVSFLDVDKKHFHQVLWKMLVFQDFDHQ